MIKDETGIHVNELNNIDENNNYPTDSKVILKQKSSKNKKKFDMSNPDIILDTQISITVDRNELSFTRTSATNASVSFDDKRKIWKFIKITKFKK